MPKVSLITHFAPPERASDQDLMDQRAALERHSLIKALLDAIPEFVVVLNQCRQIIMANQSMTDLLGLTEDKLLIGLRPGEALNCIHAGAGSAGCGTSEFCRTCGAVQAILRSFAIGRDIQECRISRVVRGMEAPLELLVRATEFEIDGRKFALFAAQDVSHEKRRLSLERIFFHDILNTVGGLRGVSEILKEEADGPLKEIAEVVYDTTHALVNEIQAQRNLLAAETGDLQVSPTPLNTRHFLDELIVRYRKHETFRDRNIYVDPEAAEIRIVTDPTLLGRVLGNLIKNAIEAVNPGETVTVGCRAEDDQVEFRVHNPGVMPRDVQLQMFKRSFSTKGQGHGLGTYSVKLLTENYLSGKVDFTSNPEEGTIFRVNYPLSIE